MSSSHLARAAMVGLAVLAVACGDLTRQKATYPAALTSFSVFTITGTPPAEPNALSFLGGVSRASSGFAFDVAFDIDSSGRAIIYPVRTLGGAPAGSLKRVGLQIVNSDFDLLTQVPETGYDTSSTLTVPVGTTVAVQLLDGTTCFSYSILTSQLLYAKMVVDSIFPSQRRVYGRIVLDPNCGYLGVVADSIPNN